MGKKIGTKKEAVLRFIDSRGEQGATDEEIQIGLGMDPSTQRPRRIELYREHAIVKMRSAHSRLTRTGHTAGIWVSWQVASALSPERFIFWR